jgi:hypothetical protein
MTDDYKPMTAEFLKNKGRCCKSTCVHCPYGHTVKKLGIQFRDVIQSDQSFLDTLGCTESISDCTIAIIKEEDFAIFTKNHILITNFWIHPEFSNQNISKEIVESYFFY